LKRLRKPRSSVRIIEIVIGLKKDAYLCHKSAVIVLTVVVPSVEALGDIPSALWKRQFLVFLLNLL
jgi:hypothetical protein